MADDLATAAAAAGAEGTGAVGAAAAADAAGAGTAGAADAVAAAAAEAGKAQDGATGTGEGEFKSLTEDVQPEDKPGETKAAEQDGGKQAPSVPEKYELSMPEGMPLDESWLESVTPILKSTGASNEVVQKLADASIKALAAQREKQLDADNATVKSWQQEISKDPEFGGAKLAENLAGVKKLLLHYGNEDFYNYLHDSRLDTYPGFVKVMFRMAKDFADDRFISGEGAPGRTDARSEAARMLFPKSLGIEGGK